eukprot:CAMPEP_0170401218 /NCGR_PEP_ID=MMETSP0117_2-20130122/24908_1 /TAXON_ID=400756 /ORGANISM="Durinskia baltica, Strain CSIRO CS-38" /LENGTH=144 /DNA_ID=CAMNT_0010658007 /DNA_START=369 /DNA_END=805 /DNA_ORIENTATION=-
MPRHTAIGREVGWARMRRLHDPSVSPSKQITTSTHPHRHQIREQDPRGLGPVRFAHVGLPATGATAALAQVAVHDRNGHRRSAPHMVRERAHEVVVAATVRPSQRGEGEPLNTAAAHPNMATHAALASKIKADLAAAAKGGDAL